MNKKFLVLLPILALGALSACGGNKPAPTPEPKANDGKSAETAYTVEEMIGVMAEYTGGQISQEEYYVQSTLAEGSTYDSNYGSWTAYDAVHNKDAEKPFQFYSCQMDEAITKNYKGNGCLDGAKIVVKGYAQLYQPKEGNAVYEICYLSKSKSPTGEATSPVILSVEGGKEYVQPDATAIAIGEDFSLLVGDTKTLSAKFTPADGKHSDVVWTSSETGVATVEAGLVTAVSAGSSVITATAGTLTASVTVTVTEPVAPVVTLDFSADVTEGLKAKADVTAGEAYEATFGEITYTILNAYQGSPYAPATDYYLMFNSKGYSAAAMFANKTAFASAIKSIEITSSTGGSASAEWSVVVSDEPVTEAQTVEEPVKLEKGASQTISFEDNTTAKYFSITSGSTKYNGQLGKIVITLAA